MARVEITAQEAARQNYYTQSQTVTVAETQGSARRGGPQRIFQNQSTLARPKNSHRLERRDSAEATRQSSRLIQYSSPHQVFLGQKGVKMEGVLTQLAQAADSQQHNLQAIGAINEPRSLFPHQALPYQAINNNITVNVNLNVTAERAAEQSSQIAQRIIQALPQQVTRQSPFSQFITDPNRSGNVEIHHTANQMVPTSGSLFFGGAGARTSHRRKDSKLEDHVTESLIQQVQSMEQRQKILQSVYDCQGVPSKQTHYRPTSAKRNSSHVTKQISIQGSSLQPNQTTLHLSSQHQQRPTAQGRFSNDTLHIEGQRKLLQHQNLDLEQLVIRPSQTAIPKSHNPSTAQPNTEQELGELPRRQDLTRSKSSLTGASTGQQQPEISKVLAPTFSRQDESNLLAGVTQKNQASRFSPLARSQDEKRQTIMAPAKSPQPNPNKTMTQPQICELQSIFLAGGGSILNSSFNQQVPQPTTEITQRLSTQLPLGSFPSSSISGAASNMVNFKGFSAAGKPVQIKHHQPEAHEQATRDSVKKHLSQSYKHSETVPKAVNATEPSSSDVKVAADRTYAEFQTILQKELEIQQKMRSFEAYNLRGQNVIIGQPSVQNVMVANAQVHNGHLVLAQTNVANFSRPGRKVVQRPPSAKQKLQPSEYTRSTGQSQTFSAQSIVLRRRGANTNAKQMTQQQQYLQAVRNQRDAVSQFLDKRATESTQGQLKKPATQISSAPQPGISAIHHASIHAERSSNREFGGLIQVAGNGSGAVSDFKQQHREGQTNQLPAFIKKAQAQSHTLVSEQHKQSALPSKARSLLAVHSADRQSDSAMITQKASQSPVRDVLPRNSMPLTQAHLQRLIQDSSSMRQDLETSSAYQNSSDHDRLRRSPSPHSKAGQPDKTLTIQKQHLLEASLSPKLLQHPQQMPAPVTMSPIAPSKRQASTKALLGESRDGIKESETYARVNQAYQIMSSIQTPQKQNVVLLVVPKSDSKDPKVFIDFAGEQKKSQRRPSRQNRPKSGVPMNRAPFRPSGIAQPSEIASPGKRAQIAKNPAGKDEATAKYRANSSQYDSKRLFAQREQAKMKEDSCDESYGDEDASYYSDDEDGDDDQELLEYDDQQEYSPVKASKVQESAARKSDPLIPTEAPKASQEASYCASKIGASETPSKQKVQTGKKQVLDDSEVPDQLIMSANDEEECLSGGYLDNGEAEDEAEAIQASSPPQHSILSSIKAPEKVRSSLNTVIAQAPIGNTSSQNATIRPSLGISASAKAFEKPKCNNMENQSSSKKSLQLSDTCPKENLVRQLYQRPGVLASIEGLNSRLRSMSMRRSQEQDSAACQNHARQEQACAGSYKQIVEQSSHTLEKELKDRVLRADNFNASDPYTQSNPVYLCKSPFTGRPPTVFFQYPPNTNEKEKPIEKEHIFKMKQHKFKMKFKIVGVHTYNCVVNSLTWNGFTQTDGSGWNMLWSAPLKPETLRNYDMYKHCNHFAGTWQIGRKDLMFRNISAQMREYGEEYNIVPKTWILPYDLRLFQKERDEASQKTLWILKPAASSCGRGIKILGKNNSIPKKGAYVVNQYIMKPHLINGFKYDLRIYVLVTSFEPLTIYIYNDGLVRFATQPYSTKNKKSRFAHLTNFSVNKKAPNYKKAGEKGEHEENSSKWRLRTLINTFKNQGLDWTGLWDQIKDVVIKAVISVDPILANNLNRASRNRHLCFELFGFDVLIDANMKPWLLEVNVLPSLACGSQLDRKVKTSLMTDIFSTVGFVPYNRKKLERAQEYAYWHRFSGLKPPTLEGGKQLDFKTDDGQNYFGEYKQETHGRQVASASASDPKANYGNVPSPQARDEDDESSEEENLAWTQTQNNMAQSQSNYLQSKIRSVKEIVASQCDFNIEEQMVIVELCEEYCRRGEFDLIFPRKANVDQYKKYFKVQRASNTIVWKWLKLNSAAPPTASKSLGKGSRLAESRNQHDVLGVSSVVGGGKTRFSVLKDFNIRKNCSARMIEDIKSI